MDGMLPHVVAKQPVLDHAAEHLLQQLLALLTNLAGPTVPAVLLNVVEHLSTTQLG